MQYVTGAARFRSLTLAVGPGTFIPREGTAAVVERAQAVLPQGGVLADLCTGCGTIALAIANERPDATVYGSDIAETALEWAERNRLEAGLDVTFFLGAFFDPFPAQLRGRLDVVVSNPPHVPTGEGHLLPRDVFEHEPAEALFAGPDGLVVINRLAIKAPEWLTGGGWFVCEIGDTHEDAVLNHLNALGYEKTCCLRDESGRRRVAMGQRP